MCLSKKSRFLVLRIKDSSIAAETSVEITLKSRFTVSTVAGPSRKTS